MCALKARPTLKTFSQKKNEIIGLFEMSQPGRYINY